MLLNHIKDRLMMVTYQWSTKATYGIYTLYLWIISYQQEHNYILTSLPQIGTLIGRHHCNRSSACNSTRTAIWLRELHQPIDREQSIFQDILHSVCWSNLYRGIPAQILLQKIIGTCMEREANIIANTYNYFTRNQ